MNSDSPKNPPLPKIYVCTNFRSGARASCGERGSRQIFEQLRNLVNERSAEIDVEQIACLGQCGLGPNVRVSGQEIMNGVSSDDLPAIVDAAIGAGNGTDGQS